LQRALFAQQIQAPAFLANLQMAWRLLPFSSALYKHKPLCTERRTVMKDFALAIAIAFASAVAFAEDRALPSADKAESPAEKASPDAIGHPSTQYQSLDTDGDGYLSQSEAQANSAINFSELDADKDGKLSLQELADAQRKGGSASSRPGAAGRAAGDTPSDSGAARGGANTQR